MHLVEIRIFSINNVTVRFTQIMWWRHRPYIPRVGGSSPSAGCFSLLFWLSSIYHNNLTTLCIASTILGSFVVPLIPIVTECTAEVTYPISEDISVGILLVGGNYISIFMTLLVQWLIDQVPLGPPPFLPSSILLFVALLVSTISVLFFEGDYRRLKVDQVSSSPSSWCWSRL